MAINTVREKVVLRLELDGGIVAGKQKISPKSYSQIKNDAMDENLYNAATTLAGLQQKDLLNVKRIETTNLIQG
jgi:hypothetical protein